MRLGSITSARVQAGRGTAFDVQKAREMRFDCIDLIKAWGIEEAYKRTAAPMRDAGLRP